MSQESCNLNKDEAASPPSSPPHTSLCIKAPQEFSSQEPEKIESFIKVPCKLKAKKVPNKPLAQFGTNRCSCCSKKVGLIGFRCRCGGLFCSGHRYSDMHDCSFDYKAFGREEISKANPLIRAAKIIKI